MIPEDPHQNEELILKGKISDAQSAMILVHGRGADAESIITIANEFNNDKYLYAAPQANGNTWYPYSFLSPVESNEPYLTSALKAIERTIKKINDMDIPNNEIILLGFSQGACLVLEYATRNAGKYKGIIGLSGGLIGDKIIKPNYKGSFDNTPVFLGCSDIDPHIPLSRVEETAFIMEELNAFVTKRIYSGMGHTINEDEINFIKSIL